MNTSAADMPNLKDKLNEDESKSLWAQLNPNKWPIPLGLFPEGTFLVGGAIRDGLLKRLDNLGVEYTEHRVDTNSRYQVFFFDPNGVKIELDFQASEVGDRLAPS